ncbi:MAG: glycogen branching enzyme [Candidatus Omnitrophica bacterium ADurb.Bin277]|nr:MAG: glycogen branching enzyme [Candidatus Omnitrophica bacterium ADurb.Bin277]
MARAPRTSSKTSSVSKTCSKPRAQTVEFKFYAPQAKKVSVGGGFNNWNPEKTPLKKDASGNWKTSVQLSAGRYEYRYLVDGNWQNSQEPVECVPNAFGSWNCVLEVR